MDAGTFKTHGATEAYEVVRTLEIVTKESRTCRIEILRELLGAGKYCARYYVHTHDRETPWARADAGWVDRPDIESATDQAVGFITLWSSQHRD